MTDYQRALDEGKRLRQTGQLHQSIEAFRQATTLQPTIPEAHYYLGFVLAEANNAVDAANSFHQAVHLKPDYGEALYELGRLFLKVGRYEDAAGYFKRVVKLIPSNPQVHYSLGVASAPYDIEGAVTCFQKALSLKPDFLNARTALLMAINYLPEYDARAIYREHKAFSVMHEKPATQDKKLLVEHVKTPGEKLRIGYVSADLRKHPVGCFMEPVLSNHDRERFEVFVFYNHPVEDATSNRLREYVDHWHNIVGMADDQAKKFIQNKSIDILIDLSGHTVGNRLMLFAGRLAPVQATWLGGPATTGLSSIDYFITDQISDPPDQQAYFSEKLIYLPGVFSCFMPMDEAPDIVSLPAKKCGFVTFGSLHGLNKITPIVINLWATILKSIPDAKLLIFRHTLNGEVKDKLQQAFVNCGVNIDRLDFRGEEVVAEENNYLKIYNEIDVLLDTFPWSGHTTACEAMWMGVPAVTLRSDRHAGRTVASVLHQVGLPHLVAESTEEYQVIVSRLVGDLDSLDELRRSLRTTMKNSLLCDGNRFTRNLESILLNIYEERVLENGKDAAK
jgi:predicted O-linked N-acetylglucosamine transferase (SPINDLY family)